MPYTSAQNALFRAAAHSKAISKKTGIPMATAARMASEGIKRKNRLSEKAGKK